MQIYEIPTGTKVFDWKIPKEWNIRDAYVMDEDGVKVIDFNKNNLHVVGYSSPLDKIVTFDELQGYLYSLKEQPEVIPYVTSYYNEKSGFCISENQRKSLKKGNYHIFIDSELKDGSLTYGEILIPGELEKEIFLSTYICHPSLANDNLSGPCVAIQLSKYIMELNKRRYSYRIIFVPETIGAIAYLSKNIDSMKRNIIAGYILTCLGDSGKFSYLESRNGNTLSDRAALNILNSLNLEYKKYSYMERGSDERQYCSAGVDLPVCTVMRSKYGEFKEYHTSDDNMDFVNAKALEGSFQVMKACIIALEKNYKYKVNYLCEPQLSKRGLYPDVSMKNSATCVRDMMNFLAYADGTKDLFDISDKINVPISKLADIVEKLIKAKIIRTVYSQSEK